MGRLITMKTLLTIQEVLSRLAWHLDNPKAMSIAFPQGHTLQDHSRIQRIGICAGSGGSLLNGLQNVDVLITGELSHHEALAATERGVVVVCLGHSNSERGYLHRVMQPKLLEALRGDSSIDVQESEVFVSEKDRDPFLTWIRSTD